MSEQPGPVAFVSLRSTTATGPYNGEKTLNLNCPAKADHLIGDEETGREKIAECETIIRNKLKKYATQQGVKMH